MDEKLHNRVDSNDIDINQNVRVPDKRAAAGGKPQQGTGVDLPSLGDVKGPADGDCSGEVGAAARLHRYQTRGQGGGTDVVKI